MNLANDLKHVGRGLAKAPLFTAIAVMTIAVAIGANAAIFGVVNGILLKPLPYPEPERLVAVWQTAPGLNIKDLNASPSTYFTYRAESKTFVDIGIWQMDALNVTGIGQAEQVSALDVTDGILPLLGAHAVAGRLFTRTDDQPKQPRTAILSYAYWQRRFGGERAVIGREIKMDGEPREVIGVLAPGFRFLDVKADIIVPMQLDPKDAIIGNFSYQAIARLRRGITIAQADADVARMLPILFRTFRPAPGMSIEMVRNAGLAPSVRPLKQDVVGDVGTVLWVLMGTVGVVLLISCANVANLLLVRAEARQQELTIRIALGASRWQIAQQLMAESLALAISGGLFGLGLGFAALRSLLHLAPTNLPRLDEISLDGTVLAFTAAASLLAGLCFGLVPVLRYGGSQLGSSLREGGRSLSESRERHRTRSLLVVVQVALALVLLVSAGLMIRTLVALKQVRPGFTDPQHIQTMRVFIPESEIKDPVQVVRAWSDFAGRMAAIPGVETAGLSNSITMDGRTSNDPLSAEGKDDSGGKIAPIRREKTVGPNYFKAMGNPIVAGRDFTWTDSIERRPVVVVSENLAKEIWGSANAAIGKRVHEVAKAPWREVIGVCGDIYDDGPSQKATATVYWPILVKGLWGEENNLRRSLSFAVRSSRAGSQSLLTEMKGVIWSANRNLAIAEVRTVADIYDKSTARTSFTLVLLTIASGLALLLGLVGIYGVVSYSIAQRTREIGIRMALGAQQNSVRRMFVRHALALTATGVAVGLVAAIAETRLLASLLFNVSRFDPLTFAGVAVLLLFAAVAASYVPARKASSIDPIEALRAD